LFFGKDHLSEVQQDARLQAQRFCSNNMAQLYTKGRVLNK
jgi:hypothetical protein